MFAQFPRHVALFLRERHNHLKHLDRQKKPIKSSKKITKKNCILFWGRDGEAYTIAGMWHTHSNNLDRQKKPQKNKIQKKPL